MQRANYPHFWVYGRCHNAFVVRADERPEEEPERAEGEQPDADQSETDSEAEAEREKAAQLECKTLKGKGERLFSAHEVAPHVAMPLMAKLLRNSIPLPPPPPPPPEGEGEDESSTEGMEVAVPNEDGDTEDYQVCVCRSFLSRTISSDNTEQSVWSRHRPGPRRSSPRRCDSLSDCLSASLSLCLSLCLSLFVCLSV